MKFSKGKCHLGEIYLFQCPGCGYSHWVRDHGKPRWSIFGLENNSPTVSPSILVRGQYRCHSFIRDGNIQFLSDCTHNLAGKTVELPDWDEDEKESDD
jgi:hypothetical protein